MSVFHDMHALVCPYRIAGAMGLEVVVPDIDGLQLDIDCEADLALADGMVRLLLDNRVQTKIVRTTRSKGGNWHVYLKIDWPDDLDPVTRIALQACLGSDRKRELLSLLRHVFGTQNPATVLFERRESARA